MFTKFKIFFKQNFMFHTDTFHRPAAVKRLLQYVFFMLISHYYNYYYYSSCCYQSSSYWWDGLTQCSITTLPIMLRWSLLVFLVCICSHFVKQDLISDTNCCNQSSFLPPPVPRTLLKNRNFSVRTSLISLFILLSCVRWIKKFCSFFSQCSFGGFVSWWPELKFTFLSLRKKESINCLQRKFGESGAETSKDFWSKTLLMTRPKPIALIYSTSLQD